MTGLTYEDLINFANFLIGPALIYAGWTLHDLKTALKELAKRQEVVEKDIIKLQTMQGVRQEQRTEDKADAKDHFEKLEKSIQKLATIMDEFIKRFPPSS